MENHTASDRMAVSLVRRRRFGYFLTIVLLGVGGLFIWHLSTQKSVGKITQPLSPESQEPREEKVSLTKYEGKYFTFLYPSDFEARFSGEDVKFPVLERQLLARTHFEGQKIAVVVQDITGYSLDEYGAYRVRAVDGVTYKEERYEKNGLFMTLFTKSSPVFESGVFWQLENKAVSLILSSPLKGEGLKEELETLLESLEFKKD